MVVNDIRNDGLECVYIYIYTHVLTYIDVQKKEKKNIII